MQENPATLAPSKQLVSPGQHLPVQQHSPGAHHADLRESYPYLLLANHLPLVRRVCDRFKDCGEPVEDLALVGLGGLLEAVAEFEPISDLDFVPFAMPLIVDTILDYFKDKGWAVRNPGQLTTQKAMVDRVLEGFEQRFNRPPTIPQIVNVTGLSAEMVLQTMESPSQ